MGDTMTTYTSASADIERKKTLCSPPPQFDYGRILFASPTSPNSPKIPILLDAERSRDLSASEREALRTSPVSPLAWHVVCGETQSRGTNMAEYNEGWVRCSKNK